MQKELIDEAVAAKEKAYAPYSGFRVGVSLSSSGKVFIGFNIENASYSLTICAERVAAINAVINGCRDFDRMVIASDGEKFPYPCGACLQFLSEFNKDMEVILVNGKKEFKITSLRELFPSPFSL